MVTMFGLLLGVRPDEVNFLICRHYYNIIVTVYMCMHAAIAAYITENNWVYKQGASEASLRACNYYYCYLY